LTVLVVFRSAGSGHTAIVEYAGSGNKGFSFGQSGIGLCADNYVATRTSIDGLAANTPGVGHWEMRTSSPQIGQAAYNRTPITTATLACSVGSTKLAVGGSLLYNQWWFTGDIYEIIYVNRLLTTAERNLLTRRYIGPRYTLTMGSGYNVSTDLSIPTYDGSGQAIHPDVYVAPTTWSGHKYWMAFTPWPSDPFENPSILCSDDNVTWAAPVGLTNPVEPAPGVGYNSDTDLLLSPDGVTMYLFWRLVGAANTETLYVASSTDGVVWGGKTAIVTGAAVPAGTAPQRVLSPAVLFYGGQYWMWTVRNTGSAMVVDYWTASAPAGTWTRNGSSTVTLPTTTAPFTDRDIWHINVEHVEGQLMMTINDNGTCLFLAKSGDGINWTTAPAPVLTIGNAWDSVSLYRSAVVPTSDGKTLRIWYAGKTTAWRIGYTEVPIADIF
jgi:hypothetical protein